MSSVTAPARQTARLTLGVILLALSSGATTLLVAQAPSVKVVAPNKGERAYVGAAYLIEWTSTGTINSFDAELSTDGGTTYGAITGCTGLAGGVRQCWWTPSAVAASARVRVVAHPPIVAPVLDAS